MRHLKTRSGTLVENTRILNPHRGIVLPPLPTTWVEKNPHLVTTKILVKSYFSYIAHIVCIIKYLTYTHTSCNYIFIYLIFFHLLIDILHNETFDFIFYLLNNRVVYFQVWQNIFLRFVDYF